MQHSCLTASEESGPILCSHRITAWRRAELVTHLVSYIPGKQELYIDKNKTSSSARGTKRRSLTHRLAYKPWTTILFFYSTRCQELTALEDSSQESFRAQNPQKKYNKKGQQSRIPFLLKTSLYLSYLLHNLMSKELFGKAIKCKNKKQEGRRKKKIEQKKVKGKSLDSRDGT